MEELKEKVVLVTGGGRGLGEAVCQTLSSAGASVIVADIRLELAEKVAHEIRTSGKEAIAMPLDVTSEEQAEATVQKVTTQYGQLDALINNAGTDVTLSVEELAINDWDQILAVNLRGPFLMSKFALPIMKEQGSGNIINIISTAAKRA